MARPPFSLYKHSARKVVAKVVAFYDRRRERKKMLDPSYDRSLLKRVDLLLANTSNFRAAVTRAPRPTSSI